MSPNTFVSSKELHLSIAKNLIPTPGNSGGDVPCCVTPLTYRGGSNGYDICIILCDFVVLILAHDNCFFVVVVVYCAVEEELHDPSVQKFPTTLDDHMCSGLTAK